MVVVLEERGESGRARALIGRLEAAGDVDEAQTRAIFDFTRARVLRADGLYEEALEAAERAFAIRHQRGISSPLSKWGLTEALEAALALGDSDAAKRLLGELDAVPLGHLTPLLRAQQARFRARLGEGDPEADFVTAEQRFRELGTPFYRAVTLLEHGEQLVALGRTEDAEPRVAEAREIFGQLGARPWLERAAALAGAAEPGVPA
jgi:tetratricopeptide (TPR) repeat protein